MTAKSGDLVGHFLISYDDDEQIFEACVYVPDSDAWMRAEMAISLEELLEMCRERGLEHFAGLTKSAANRIHHWLVIERPALQFVESHWGTNGPSSQGPIGFRIQPKKA